MRFTDAYKPAPIESPDTEDFFSGLDQTLARAEQTLAGIESDRLGARANIRAQVATAAPRQTPAQLGYNPRTQEFFVGGRVIPADVSAIKAIAELEDLPEIDGPLPNGFLPFQQDRVRERNAFLDENKESDLFSWSRPIGMAEATLGGLTSGVGNLLGQDWENPMEGMTAGYRRNNQSIFEQYGQMERPTESLVGAVNALGQAFETGVPVIATGLGVGAATLNPLAGLAAAGALGGTMAADDAGGETRDRLQELVVAVPDAELVQANEDYARLRYSMGEEEAKAELVRRGVLASSWSAGGIAALSSAAGVGLARLIPKGAFSQPTDALSRLLRGRTLGAGAVNSGVFPALRATTGVAGLTALGEGTSEYLERDLSQNAGDIAAGLRSAALGKYGTIDDFAAGAIGGAALGGPAAYTSSAALQARDPRRATDLPEDMARPEDVLNPPPVQPADFPADAVTPNDVMGLDPRIAQRRGFEQRAAEAQPGETVPMFDRGIGPEPAPPAEPGLTVDDINVMLRAAEFEEQRLRKAGNVAEADNLVTQMAELQALRDSMPSQTEPGLLTPDGAPNPELVRGNQEVLGEQIVEETLRRNREAARVRRGGVPQPETPLSLPAPATPTRSPQEEQAAAPQELALVRQWLQGAEQLDNPDFDAIAVMRRRAAELERIIAELPLRGGEAPTPEAPRINLRLAAQQARARGDRPTAPMVAAEVPPAPPAPPQQQGPSVDDLRAAIRVAELEAQQARTAGDLQAVTAAERMLTRLNSQLEQASTPVAPGGLFTAGGRPSQAAREATGNQTLAESQKSINAQVEEMLAKNATRDAVWVSTNPDGTPAPQPTNVPEGVEVVTTPAGTLYTTNRSKARGLRRNVNRANDPAFVSDLIGFYVEPKPAVAAAAAAGEPVASVVTKTPTGTTTASTLVSGKNVGRQVAATAAATGKTPQVQTVAQTLKERAQEKAKETPPKAAAVKAKATEAPKATVGTPPKAAAVKAKAKPVPESKQAGPVKIMTKRQYLERRIEEATDVDKIAALQAQLDALTAEEGNADARGASKGSPRQAPTETPRRKVDAQVEQDVKEALREEREGDVETGLVDLLDTPPPKPDAAPAPAEPAAELVPAPEEPTTPDAVVVEGNTMVLQPLRTSLSDPAYAALNAIRNLLQDQKSSFNIGRVRAYSKDPRTKTDQKELLGMQRIAELFNTWMDEYFPTTKSGLPQALVLLDVDSMTDEDIQAVFGGPASVFTTYRTPDGEMVSVIAYRPSQIIGVATDSKSDIRSVQLEILAHEFGHMIERNLFKTLSAEDKSAVMKEFARWRRRFTPTPYDAARAWRDRSGPATRSRFPEGARTSLGVIDYALSYKEFYADNIMRALLRRELDVRPKGPVQKFFDAVAKSLYSFWKKMIGADNPNTEIMRVLEVLRAQAAKANSTGVPVKIDPIYDRAVKELNDDPSILPIDDFKTLSATVDNATFDAEAELDRAYEQQGKLGYNVGAAVMDALRSDGTLRDRLRGAKNAVLQSKLGDRLMQLQAALMTQDQMVLKFDGMGAAAADFARELRRNVATNKRVESIASEARQAFEKAFEKAALLDGRYRSWLEQIMHDATMLKAHPDLEWSDPMNDHLRSPKEPALEEIKRNAHARLRAKYLLLREKSPEAAELYVTMRDESITLSRKIAQVQIRDLFKEIEQKLDLDGPGGAERRRILTALRSGEMSPEVQAIYDKLPAKQKGAIKALRGQIAQIRTQRLETTRGPWFPLRRRGEYIVKVPLPEDILRDTGNEPFETYEQAKRAADRAKANNPNDNARVNTLKDDDGEVYGYDVRIARSGVFFFESEGAANAAIEDMKATVERLWIDENLSPKAVRDMLDSMPEETWRAKRISDMYTTDKVVPAAVLEQLKNLQDEGLPEHLYKHFQRMALEADAHYTLNASALPRRNVIGASEDMLTALGEWVYGASYNLGMLDQTNDMVDSWSKLKKLAKGNTEQTIFLNALNKNNQLTRERRELTTANTVANVMTQVSSLMSLAFSPAYVALNATQPHVVAAPLLAGKVGTNGQRLGIVEAEKYIVDAMKGNGGAQSGFALALKNGGREFIQQLQQLVGKGSETEITPEVMFQQVLDVYARNDTERALLRSLRDMGALDFGHLAAMQDVLATSTAESKFQNITRMGMAFAQHMETMNRTVTALAAYRAATEKLGYDPVLDVDGEALTLQASDSVMSFVSSFISESMVNYSMVNRPNVFKYQWMGPLLQFKMYTQGIYAMFLRHAAMAVSSDPTKAREGRAVLLGLLGTHAMAGGFLGLGPIAAASQAAVWATVAMFGDEDEEWKDRETLTAEVMRSWFGDGVLGTAIERGLPAALLNADMSSRVGIPNLIDSRFMGIRESADGKDNFDAVALSLAGPVYSNIRRALVGSFTTVGEFADWAQGESTGDDVLRELQSASPAGFRGVVEAARYMTTGITETDGDTIISADDLGSYDTFIRAMGLTPTQVAKMYDERRSEFDTLARIDAERNDVLRMYAGAKDSGERLRARERIREFNRKVPKEFQIQPSSAERARGSRAERDAGKIDERREAIREFLGN